MIIVSKNIETPLRTINGYIEIEGNKIKHITEGRPDTEDYIDYGDNVILPGFIDLHVHGYATGSFTHEGTAASVERMGKAMASQGVTSFLPTTGADSLSRIKSMMGEVNTVMDNWTPEKGADVVGIHLEGPFLNADYNGMQNKEYCINPSIDIFKDLIEALPVERIPLITMAPELDGAKELIQYLNKNGVQVSIGHSGATFEEIKELKNYGIGGVTHMFSGMKGFHHRELGVAGSALYFDDLYCEFAKQTGLTVHPEALDIALRIKGLERITLCSDAVGLGHVSESFHHYIRQITFVPDGDHVILKHDNGDVERLDKYSFEDMKAIEFGYLDSVQNLVKNNNLTLRDIMKIGSENTAKYINIFDKKGSLEVGKDADIVILDDSLNLVQTYVSGVSQL